MLGAYVAPVASVAAHDVVESASAHRYQRALVVRFPDPEADRHVPTAPVRLSPTCATPVTAGLVSASGGGTTGASLSPAPPVYGGGGRGGSRVGAGGGVWVGGGGGGGGVEQVRP